MHYTYYYLPLSAKASVLPDEATTNERPCRIVTTYPLVPRISLKLNGMNPE